MIIKRNLSLIIAHRLPYAQSYHVFELSLKDAEHPRYSPDYTPSPPPPLLPLGIRVDDKGSWCDNASLENCWPS